MITIVPAQPPRRTPGRDQPEGSEVRRSFAREDRGPVFPRLQTMSSRLLGTARGSDRSRSVAAERSTRRRLSKAASEVKTEEEA